MGFRCVVPFRSQLEGLRPTINKQTEDNLTFLRLRQIHQKQSTEIRARRLFEILTGGGNKVVVHSGDFPATLIGCSGRIWTGINWDCLEEEMGSESIRAASGVYRNLLKAVRKNIGKEEHKAHFTDFIKQQFRAAQPVAGSSGIQQKLNLARDYAVLLNSVHHHKDLLFSYNIAVDRSEEMKKVLGKSAASVGLQLPQVYQP